MLGLHFVSTGKLPIKIGKIFGTLFEKKHSGDYDDFACCDEELVNELYPQAEIYIILKSATPFPKCYLHKEEWTFDS